MKYLIISVLIIFTLNSCSQRAPTLPCPKQKCMYPKLPIYKVPGSRSFKVKSIDSNISIVENELLIELVKNNSTMRRICNRNNSIHRKVNKGYNKK